MNIWRTRKARRGAAALAMAVTLAIGVSACGGDDDKPQGSDASEQSKGDGGGEKSKQDEPDKILAEIEGDEGMILTINAVTRDASGFVTVDGRVKNTGKSTYYKTTEWGGTEEDLKGGGQSVGGATLIDKAGKKRYYALRDTEGRCLCTSGFTQVDPGKEMKVFIQFPAPPSETREVDLQFPTFKTTTLKIEG
ncbi:hypothetical protein [Streptomyces gobiensis]|uniref:hypothetical protein n=1 Tax=Streptomyces gobiensis TaxID=2875706 RepID=UPI001E4DF970|nr:hypothetical protein [Streptomyces gobiensis]UGY93369.1 hypothetical protein test1122_17715 [Streptomyces gobiensis]